jgi:SAM-dependent methyltransferase
MSPNDDPFAALKAAQREGWALFAPLAVFTTAPAASLVEFAGIEEGIELLDAACGTGVVAITAARRGAKVRGLDLSPVLLEEARKSAALLELNIEFTAGDLEALPFPDESFDVVVSQFGHMFAPRPAVAVKELLRVLRPGGRIAFSTWPPELLVGSLFTLAAKYVPHPADAARPPDWGDPAVIRERLGAAVQDIEFDRDEMLIPSLSPRHFRMHSERSAAPFIKVVEQLRNEPQRLAVFRAEFESLIARYFRANRIRQSFLMTRAIKR